jgi:peptidyl-prolyl cis-trans isomerase A (cyclophilin A)
VRPTLAVVVTLAACDAGKSPPAPPPPPKQWTATVVADDEVRKPTAADVARYTDDLPGTGSRLAATIETSSGTLHCDLYRDTAPMAVANFVGLARGLKPWTDPRTGATSRQPFYDGLTFHRVIPGFMIQGGDPLGRGVGGPGYTFADEIRGMPMLSGTLAMANAGPGPNREGTNGSQFFIMETGDRPDLAQVHTIFGRCGELDVVKAIARAPRDATDKPTTNVTIRRISFAKRPATTDW